MPTDLQVFKQRRAQSKPIRMWLAAAFVGKRARVCIPVLCWLLISPQRAFAQNLDFRAVKTGQELQKAVFDGVKHIVISKHLDMVHDPLWDQQYGSVSPSVPKKSMLSVANGTQIITGNCTEPFPEVLDPPASTDSQCVVTVFEDFMDNKKVVWISNLYLRLDGSRSRAIGVNDTVVDFDTSVFFVQNADMYLTNVVMRGLSELGYEGRGVDMMDPASWGLLGNARLYARECYFGNFMKSQGSALRLQAGNRATLKRCRFYDNYIRPGDVSPEDSGPAIAAVSKPHKDHINPDYTPAGLWLHSCEFRNNTPGWRGPVAINGSAVYSDMRTPEVVDFVARTVQEPTLLRRRSPATAVAGAVWNASGYLTEADPWFQAVVKDFEAVVGAPLPEYSFDALSLDITASTPPPGRPLLPPPPRGAGGPPGTSPFDTPGVAPRTPLQAPIPPPPPSDSRDTANQDIVLIAAAVAGGVGVLLLGLIAVYCGLTRHDRADSDDPKTVTEAATPPSGTGDYTPVATLPPAGRPATYGSAYAMDMPARVPQRAPLSAGSADRPPRSPPGQHLWPAHASLPAVSPAAPAPHPTSPLACTTSAPHTYPYHQASQPQLYAPAHALPGPHNYGPPAPASIHSVPSMPAPSRVTPEPCRTHSDPSGTVYSYPQNVYPYNPGSRGGSERSSQAYSHPGQPLSRGPSGGPPVPNPAGALPTSSSGFYHGTGGTSKQSGLGNSCQSSYHDGAHPRAPDSASYVPSPPSSFGRSHQPRSPSPPERIQSRFTPKVPRSLMSSRDSALAYLAVTAPSTHGSTGTAGGGSRGGGGCSYSYSSNGGSAARGASAAAGGGPAAAAPCEPDSLAALSAASQRQRKLGSPLAAAKQRSLVAEVTAAGGVAAVSDLETNHGSAIVDNSSRFTLPSGAVTADTSDGRQAKRPAGAGGKHKPPLRIDIAMPLVNGKSQDSREDTEQTRDLDFSLSGLDIGDTLDTEHQVSHTRDSGPLPDALKPSLAKFNINGHGSRPASLLSGMSRTGSADPGPSEPPQSAKLHSSRPSSSFSARGIGVLPTGGCESIGPASASPATPSPSGHHPSPPPPPSSGAQRGAGPAAVARTVTLDDASSSFGMSHSQFCAALDALTARNAVLQQQYMLLDASLRRLSGHGVVQFAETQPTEVTVSESVALKFYLVHAAFDRVVSLRSQRALAGVTCAVLDTVKGNDIAGWDPAFAGGAELSMPPMVVTRRGLTLEAWAARGPPALPALTRALAAICARLAELHACGYVYYAVKPTNVAWFEWDGGWQLIDFGRAARAGVNVGLTFSLQYAAPELAASQQPGAPTPRSHASADIWALGVVAYELAAGCHAFPPDASPAAIRTALLGDTAASDDAQPLRLPWEQRGGARVLGMLRHSVLSCLARDPAARPTADELVTVLHAVLERSARDAGSVPSTHSS
eukprot:jgi/Ulvmu1/3641/UM017_0055.1